MKNPLIYGAHNVRAAYSHHILRAHAQGFAPVSLAQFVALAAHAVANLI